MSVCGDVGYLVQFVVVVAVVVVRGRTVVVAAADSAAAENGDIPDPDWLLIGSLKPFVVEACSGQSVRLRCPRGLTVSVLTANHGPDSSSACSGGPPNAVIGSANGVDSARLKDIDNRSTLHRSSTSVAGSGLDEQWSNVTSTGHERGQRSTLADGCAVVNSLQVVASLCQKKAQCSVRVTSRLFQRPAKCSSDTVFRLSVSYQCRPSEFRTRPVCPGQTITLRCDGSERLVFQSASYSPLVGGPCAESPSSANVRITANSTTSDHELDCDAVGRGLSPDGYHLMDARYRWQLANCPALVAVDNCHGRSSCVINSPACRQPKQANDTGPMIAMRLVYACVLPLTMRVTSGTDDQAEGLTMSSLVCLAHSTPPQIDTQPRRVLDDEIMMSSSPPAFVNDQSNVDVDYDNFEPAAATRLNISINTDLPSTDLTAENSSNNTITSFLRIDGDWIWAWNFIKCNGEKTVLYASLGALLGLIVLLSAIAIRLWLIHVHNGKYNFPSSTPSTYQVSTSYTATRNNSSIKSVDKSRSEAADQLMTVPMVVDDEADEVEATVNWHRYPAVPQVSREDRYATPADHCDTSCATMLMPRSPSSTMRPMLQFDDD